MKLIFYFLADHRRISIKEAYALPAYELENWLDFYGFDNWLEKLKNH